MKCSVKRKHCKYLSQVPFTQISRQEIQNSSWGVEKNIFLCLQAVDGIHCNHLHIMSYLLSEYEVNLLLFVPFFRHCRNEYSTIRTNQSDALFFDYLHIPSNSSFLASYISAHYVCYGSYYFCKIFWNARSWFIRTMLSSM